MTESTTIVNIILQRYLQDRPDLNYSLRSQHHNKTLIMQDFWTEWKEILLLEIYTNIAVNFHHDILVTFVAVEFATEFYEMS